MASLPLSPWRLWQEVHAWGGPELAAQYKVMCGCVWVEALLRALVHVSMQVLLRAVAYWSHVHLPD